MKRFLLSSVLTLATAGVALAFSYTPTTVGASDATISFNRKVGSYLDVINNSPTATVCLNFGSAATISGATCAAGEITLPPLWHRDWNGAGVVPDGTLHAIASAATTPLSIGAN